MNLAGGETEIVWEHFARGSSRLLKKNKLNERSVDAIVEDIGFLSIAPTSKSDVELHDLIHCILTSSSSKASQTAMDMPAKSTY